MKKSFILIIFLHLATMSLYAGNTVTKRYDFYTIKSIDASSIYEIEVSEGDEKGVTIVYDSELEKCLEVKFLNGELILATNSKAKRIRSTNGIKVYLQMSTIEDIDLSGAAKLTASGVFKSSKLDIDLSGASSVKGLQISGRELSIDCSGASSLSIYGDFSRSIEADVSGASKVTITGNSCDLDVEASGASNVCISGDFSGTIDTDASGASKVTINGNGRDLKLESSGASSIKHNASTDNF